MGNVIATVSDRKIQAGFSAGSCIKTYDFSSGVPAGPDINYNNINLAVSGGSLVCTMINSGGISGINPKFGNNLSTSTVYQVDFDFNPGNLTTGDGLYIVPFDFNGGFWLGSYFWNSGTVPPAGHYSYTYTPTVAGPTYTTYMAFNTNASSTHSFIVDNISLCVLGTGSTVASYSPDITSHTDYYAFGQSMPGRTWVGGDKYRYGMNGQEKDDEIASGLYTAEYWEYDSRIARRWNVDPVTYEWQSPYACFNGNPILYADPDGREGQDKIVIDLDTKTQTYIEDANGKDLITVEYGHWVEGGKGFVAEYSQLYDNVGTGNAANANIDNSTRAGVNNYGFNNPNYKPTAEQQAWYNFADFANKTAAISLAGAVALPALAEELPIAANALFNKGKDEIIESANAEETAAQETQTAPAQEPQANTQPKLSKVQKSKTTETIGNGKYTKTTEVRPGKGPGQSRAEYIRYKNQDGKTIKNVKDSYDRAGKFQHRKNKPLPGNQ